MIPTEKYNAATLTGQETNTELTILRQERATLDIQVMMMMLMMMMMMMMARSSALYSETDQ